MQLSYSHSYKLAGALFYSIRPSASIGAAALAVSAYKPGSDELIEAILLIVSVFFGGAYCFIMNDIYDRDKDLLNDKKRPIATGFVSMNLAVGSAIVCVIVTLTTSLFLGTYELLLAILYLMGVSVYSFVNSKTGLFANAMVALFVSGMHWGVAILKPDPALIASSLFLFFFTVPRELLLDWLDIKGDRGSGKPSFPMNHSPKANIWVVTASLLLSTGSLYFLQNNYNTLFMVLYVLSIVTAWGSFAPFLKNADRKHALLSVRLSHISFVLLILALFSR